MGNSNSHLKRTLTAIITVITLSRSSTHSLAHTQDREVRSVAMMRQIVILVNSFKVVTRCVNPHSRSSEYHVWS